jgi:hypothetical protein
MQIHRIAGVFMLCLLCVPLMAADRRSYPMDVSAAGVQKIIFDVQEGNFILRGAPDAKDIHMMVSIDRMWIFKLGEQDLLKRLIEISGEGTPEVTVKTNLPRGITSFGRAAYPIDFEVVAPEKANLEIWDTSGKIEITEMKGAVAIEDGSGTVALHDLGGALILRKKSGDVKISDIRGATTIESDTGQMDIRRTGKLDIRNAHGNITVADAGSVHVHSRGGNLKVSDVKGDLNIDDESGEIVINRVGGDVDIRDTSGQIRAADTGPLRIRDTSGDITVHRAASLDVIAKESGKIAAEGISGNIKVPSGFRISPIH